MANESKSPKIVNLLQAFADEIGVEGPKAMNDKKCSWCGGDATTFTDELSKKEYGISGFCQKCQDNTFGGGEDLHSTDTLE